MMHQISLEARFKTDAELVAACLAEHQDALLFLFQTYFTSDRPVYFWVYQNKRNRYSNDINILFTKFYILYYPKKLTFR